MRFFNSDRPGFTVIELIVAGGIFATVMAIMYGLYVTSLDASLTARTQSELQSNARAALSSMIQERESGSPAYFQGLRYQSILHVSIPSQPNNTSITFYPPTINSDGDFASPWDTSANNTIRFEYNAFEKTVKRVWTESSEERSEIMARDVSSLLFKDISMDSTLGIDQISISLTLNKVTRNNRSVTVTSTAIVTLRN
jgi:type II secretory pathway pseudopilin PulG